MKKLFIITLTATIGLIALFQIFDKKAVADTWNGVQNYIYSFTNVTVTGTGYLKASPAFLHTVTINKPVANAVIQLSDSFQFGTSPIPIATITMPATLLSNGPITAVYDVQTVNGLTYYTTVAAQDVTISWK